LADGSYVIFVGGRRKLCNFRLVTSIGQGPTEDKVKPTENGFFRGFWLIFHRPLANGSSAVSCSDTTLYPHLLSSEHKSTQSCLPHCLDG
jgi:hypothetical protein